MRTSVSAGKVCNLFMPLPRAETAIRTRSNIANGHGPSSDLTNGDGSVVTVANRHNSGINSGYGIQASPLSRDVSFLRYHHLRLMEGEDENRRDISIHDLSSIKEFLEYPEQQSIEESLVAVLHSLVEKDVTYEVLIVIIQTSKYQHNMLL